MIAGKRILAVVPARGGSKGLPRKNLRLLCGVPLVGRVGTIVREVPEIDRVVVSTDDEEIARVSEAYGISAPFRRPESLSGDRIGDWDVLEHALTASEAIDGVHYDVVMMLQPTSPLRSPAQVLGCVRMLIEGEWDSVWTVSPTDSKAHPLKQLQVDSDVLSYYSPDASKIVARQQLPPVYHRNGIAYAFTRQCILGQRTTLGQRAGAFVTDGFAVSIDTEWDLELCEYVLGRSAAPGR